MPRKSPENFLTEVEKSLKFSYKLEKRSIPGLNWFHAGTNGIFGVLEKAP